MASGLTRPSGYFNLTRGFQKVYLEVPSFASGADVYVQGSSDGNTFRRIMHPPMNSSAAQVNTFVIPSAASNRFFEIPAGFQYLKPEISTALTDTVTNWKLVCSE
jgi:hypothetical protein